MRNRRALPLVLLAALVAGCGFFSRPEIHHYSLDPVAPAGPVIALAGPPIGVDAIELPPGFDRQAIVVREDDHRLEVRGTELWAAPLDRMVLHTLAFDLAARLPEGMIVLPGQTRPAGEMRSLDVVFEELTAGPETAVVLDARWTLRTPGGPEVSARERITEPVPSLASTEVAAGTSRALGELADRIVARVAGDGAATNRQ